MLISGLVASVFAFGQSLHFPIAQGSNTNRTGAYNYGGGPDSLIASDILITNVEAVVVVAVPEDWRVSSSLEIFAFGLAVFGVACRLGLLKAVAFASTPS